MNIVFLYTEVAEYFLSCIRELSQISGLQILIVRWPVNSEAPFEFNWPDKVKVFNRDEIDDSKLDARISKFNPDVVFCSGWMDKGYLKIAQTSRRKGVPVICGMDNAWVGSYRQRIASLISPFTIRKYFDYMWVPGKKQREYALRLGFTAEHIFEGYYSADYYFFNALYHRFLPEKKKLFPHRFFYLGRYVEQKGINDLWQAYELLLNETNTNWELWCAGTGQLTDHTPTNPGLKHIGFIQPKDLPDYIRQTGVFILPSHFEPWGVAVHEMAAAGLPMICSDKVGAAGKFLDHEKNGFLYQSGSVQDLKEAMKKIISLDYSELIAMGEYGNTLAQKITPQTWSRTLLSIASKNNVNSIL